MGKLLPHTMGGFGTYLETPGVLQRNESMLVALGRLRTFAVLYILYPVVATAYCPRTGK